MILIVDIDGSIADWKPRRDANGEAPDRKAHPEEYKSYISSLVNQEQISKDSPILGMQTLLRAMGSRTDVTLVYLTGRAEHLRTVTNQWLFRHNFPDANLIMRPNNDWRKASEYKEDVVVSYKANGHEIMAIEDEIEVVKMLVSHGVTVLQVHYKG